MNLERALDITAIVVFGALAVASLRLLRRRDVPATRWLAAMFASLTFFLTAAFALSFAGDGVLSRNWIGRQLVNVLLLVLLVFPYALHRFSVSFGEIKRPRLNLLVTIAFVGLAVATFLLPSLGGGDDGEQRWWATAYTLALVGIWGATFIGVTVRLWRGAKHEPTVARRRMRLMASAAVLLTVAMVMTTAISDNDAPSVQILTQLLLYGTGLLFYLGFATPSAARRAWRLPEERELQRAESALLSAQTVAEATDRVLPAAARLLGGNAAALFDAQRQVVAVHGFDPDSLNALRERLPEGTASVLSDREVIVPLASGWFAVEASPYTPFFGDEELELVTALSVSLQLALARIALDEREREARQTLEQRNEEIQALVYGLSHDLRNPIISVQGYVDLLRADADSFTEDQRHHLERIAVSATYMDALISDLLELSRVGRSNREMAAVDLDALVADIAEELKLRHPSATVQWDDLHAVAMNPVRARQLVTNLLDNAVRHGGHDDIAVTITAARVGGWVELKVADNGKGVPDEYREKVFGIFERLEGASMGTRGTGIGLTMCRKIVEDVGGEITIADSAVGTCFAIRLPAVATAAVTPPAVAAMGQR